MRRDDLTAPEVPRARALRVSWPARLVPPTGEDATRLTLFALVIALQNVIELPRPLIRDRLGRPLTGLLITLVLAASLALLIVSLRTKLPRWRWPRSRAVQIAVLVLTLAAVPTGLGQTAQMLAAGFRV